MYKGKLYFFFQSAAKGNMDANRTINYQVFVHAETSRRLTISLSGSLVISFGLRLRTPAVGPRIASTPIWSTSDATVSHQTGRRVPDDSACNHESNRMNALHGLHLLNQLGPHCSMTPAWETQFTELPFAARATVSGSDRSMALPALNRMPPGPNSRCHAEQQCWL